MVTNMKKILIKTSLFLGTILLAGQILAANLMQVYQQALDNDPTFKASRSTWMSERENIGISRAGLLPQFDIQANYGRNYTNNQNIAAYDSPVVRTEFYSNSGGYNVTIQQPIFNYKNWAQLSQAKSNEKQYAAQYSAAAQDLMFRTAEAYFNILKAEDILKFTLAEKQAYKSQLERVRERFKVGLATITDVHQAKASYDGSVAQEIQDRNNVAIQKEKMQEITNVRFKSYAKLTKELPLRYPNPINISQWVNVALKQNYSLLAAKYASLAAQENIHVQAAGHLPVINAAGEYDYTHTNNALGSGRDTNNNQATVGVNMDLPVFEGGLVLSQTKQAEYQYQTALDELEKTNRSVISNTRQSYLDVISGVNTIKANQQAVISARSSLESTIAGYEVGTQTMTDVLIQESNLYQTLKDYTSSQYDYIISTVALKQAAGVLSVNDLAQINSWLYSGRVKARVTKSKKVTYKAKKHVVKHNKVVLKKHVAHHETVASINPQHYTIQLLATQNSKDIEYFKRQHKLNTKTYIVRTCKLKQHWQEFIMGEYKTYAAAKHAVSMLPKNLQRIKPWVRTYASVQKTMC